VTRRIIRDAAVACLVLSATALILWPDRMGIAGGVLGGGGLIALSAWAIHAAVDGVLKTAAGRPASRWALVKFFTRHVMLALAAYGMMVRLHLDPVGMLVGVSSLVVAAGFEAVRRLQRVT
jgi:hypothetical protein